jgi:hypothetical protein
MDAGEVVALALPVVPHQATDWLHVYPWDQV